MKIETLKPKMKVKQLILLIVTDVDLIVNIETALNMVSIVEIVMDGYHKFAKMCKKSESNSKNNKIIIKEEFKE